MNSILLISEKFNYMEIGLICPKLVPFVVSTSHWEIIMQCLKLCIWCNYTVIFVNTWTP